MSFNSFSIPVAVSGQFLNRLSAIALQIHQCHPLDEILHGAVRETRDLLQCDRALIHRLLPQGEAAVAFESVGAGWLPTLGQMVYDPCLESKWLSRYQNGRTSAITNVKTESIDPCYRDLLTRLQVKANLVVPIVCHDQFWGLLIVHQCRAARSWQPLEVQMTQQIALQIAIAIQQDDLRQRLEQAAQLLDAHSSTAPPRPLPRPDRLPETKSAVSDRHREALIQNIARGVSAQTGKAFFHSLVQYLIRSLGVEQAFVGELVAPVCDRIRIIAGVSHQQILDGWEYPISGTPCAQVLKQGFCLYSDQIQQLFPEDMELRALGGRGYVGITLANSAGEVMGLLGVVSNHPLSNPRFVEEVLTIFAVRAASELERKAAEVALQELNRGLEQRVQQRTETLQQQAQQERLLRLITQRIHESFDLNEILATALHETRYTLQADRVAIYQFNSDWSGSFVAESVDAGWVALVGSDIKRVWEDTHLQQTQGGRYRNNETFAVKDIYTVGHHACHIALLEQFHARAYAIAPIFVHEKLWGLLAAYQNSAPRQWQDEDISLLQQIAVRVAIAIQQSQLYQASQAHVKELERLNQIKDDFLSTVSHELRSPMTNIKMATQMLELQLTRQGVLQSGNDTPISRYFRILHEEGQREIHLINDLLDLARLDANTQMLCPVTINLAAWVEQIAAAVVERTQQQQQQLILDVPTDLNISTDVTYLERILLELLHNACKYTPAGETIRVLARSLNALSLAHPTPEGASPQHHLADVPVIHPVFQLWVCNSGVEIPLEECDRIFDKFYRIPNHDPWKHGGTGLGLALVKKLTERINGTIRVKSGDRQTRFELTLGSIQGL